MSDRGTLDERFDGSEIAVVGMAGRFPGAPNVDKFWENLAHGVESIRFFSDEELRAAGVEPEALADPNYVRARPVLEGADLFDADFFGLSPREAEILDPQHRIFLEVAWEAFESAGYDPSRYRGAVSVFAGASFSNYLVHNLYKNRPAMESFGDLESTLHNVQDSLATMLAYKLDLRGVCCAVQTFCSTSLVGVHLASQNLLSYESDMALVGGVTIYVPETSGYLYAEGSILSRDGHCRVFDERADGTVFGNGAGAVVLKRLEDALRDGDAIQAVLRGSAVNNDGAVKLSFAAPGARGQTEVIVEALAAAGVDPDTIGLVEAHGTGTALGDPVEVRALTKAFRTKTDRTAYCALGSVKANVGHLDAAAGITGLIKAVLCLKHKQIPPSVHFEKPNPEIDLETSPFYVPTDLREWDSVKPRRAGVSAFGIGGTNAHVIVEEAPATSSDPTTLPQLLVVSAKTPTALDRAARALSERIETLPESRLADVAFTLQEGRQAFGHRLCFVAASGREARETLESGDLSRLHRGAPVRESPPLRFVFAGRGLDEAAARELYAHCPAFREELDRADSWARQRGEASVLDRLSEEPSPPVAALATEVGLAKQWLSWGLRASSTGGEGLGSLAAAVVREALSLEKALELVVEGRSLPVLARESPEPSDPLHLTIGGEAVVRLSSFGPAASGDAYRIMLGTLGQLWLAGWEIDWRLLHAGFRRSRVVLPSYPFERERYWVEPESSESAVVKREDLASWFYFVTWRTTLAPRSEESLSGHLLFVDGSGVGDVLATRLIERGHEVTVVKRGETFESPEPGTFRIRPHRGDDYDALLEALSREGRFPAAVVHLWSLDAPPEEGEEGPDARGDEDLDARIRRFDQTQDLGFYGLLPLLRSLAKKREAAPIDVKVVSAGAHEVTGQERLCPDAAPLAALVKVASQEYENLRCGNIDLDAGRLWSEAALPEKAPFDRLVRELELPTGEPVVAFRGGKRWTSSYENIPLREHDASSTPLRERGVVLVTGGLGEVGFSIAAYLAKKFRARLILTGRTALPPPEEWERLAAEVGGQGRRIQKLRRLESLGSEVLFLQADVTSEEQMKSVLDVAAERFGAVNGIVHAAGDLSPEGFSLLDELNPASCERQLGPKARGILVLERLLRGRTLDFWFLTSSLSSVLGGLGYAAYAAANAFLDAYGAARNRDGRGVWKVVDWDQWNFDASQAKGGVHGSSLEELAMTPVEGLVTFEQILRMDYPRRVVVSTAPLEARLSRWVDPVRTREAPASRHSRPAALGDYVAPRNETEEAVARMWQELLGIDRIGIHDDFFSLGGHSLFAARVISRLKDAFSVSLPLASVFDKPTVAGLSERVQAALWARNDDKAPAQSSLDRVEIEL